MKNKLLIIAISAFLGAGLVGCASNLVKGPERTTLELQQLQTREYDTTVKLAVSAVMSVFQDCGYVVSTADLETGLVVAKSPSTQRMVAFNGRFTNYEKATALVEQVAKNRVRIRVSVLQYERITGAGMTGEEEIPRTDAEVYQNIFAKIQKAIFLKENM